MLLEPRGDVVPVQRRPRARHVLAQRDAEVAGRVDLDRAGRVLQHERQRWYDRLVAEGRLDEHRVRDEWLRWKNIARAFGYFFFGLGVLLLLLIIYAMITRLTHGG